MQISRVVTDLPFRQTAVIFFTRFLEAGLGTVLMLFMKTTDWIQLNNFIQSFIYYN